MLRKPNGLPYKTSGCLQQFNPEAPELCLFNIWDAEAIRIGGAPILYHEVFIQIGSLDQLYREDRGKLWSPVGIQLWAIYEPVPSENFQNAFGIDAPTELVFECNYREVLNAIGHPPKIGSRIYTPHKQENWVLIQRNLGEYKMWGEIRIQLLCQRFQESVTDSSVNSKVSKPDFTIN